MAEEGLIALAPESDCLDLFRVCDVTLNRSVLLKPQFPS